MLLGYKKSDGTDQVSWFCFISFKCGCSLGKTQFAIYHGMLKLESLMLTLIHCSASIQCYCTYVIAYGRISFLISFLCSVFRVTKRLSHEMTFCSIRSASEVGHVSTPLLRNMAVLTLENHVFFNCFRLEI